MGPQETQPAPGPLATRWVQEEGRCLSGGVALLQENPRGNIALARLPPRVRQGAGAHSEHVVSSQQR